MKSREDAKLRLCDMVTFFEDVATEIGRIECPLARRAAIEALLDAGIAAMPGFDLLTVREPFGRDRKMLKLGPVTAFRELAGQEDTWLLELLGAA